MMHDDLEPLLNESVFRALDVFANVSIKEKMKIVKSLPRPRRLELF